MKNNKIIYIPITTMAMWGNDEDKKFTLDEPVILRERIAGKGRGSKPTYKYRKTRVYAISGNGYTYLVYVGKKLKEVEFNELFRYDHKEGLGQSGSSSNLKIIT